MEGGQRRRLQLAPRSKKAGAVGGYAAPSTKSSIFGAARPREEILKSKGIDFRKVEEDLEKRTSSYPRMDEKALENVKAIESEISHAKSELEEISVDASAEEKQKLENVLKTKEAELTTFLESVVAQNAANRKFERPSERRRRQEDNRRENGDYGSRSGNHDDTTFSNFGNSRNRRNSGGRRNRQRGNDNRGYDNRSYDNGGYGNGGYNSRRKDSFDRDEGGRNHRQKYDHIDRALEGDDNLGEAW